MWLDVAGFTQDGVIGRSGEAYIEGIGEVGRLVAWGGGRAVVPWGWRVEACSHSAGPAEGFSRFGGGAGVAPDGVGGVVGPGGTAEVVKVRAQSASDASRGSVRRDEGMVADGNGDHAPGV